MSNTKKSKQAVYRIRKRDGLPKLYKQDEWLQLVLDEKPDKYVLGGLVRYLDEVHIFLWSKDAIGVLPIARLAGNMQFVRRFNLEEQETLNEWAGKYS